MRHRLGRMAALAVGVVALWSGVPGVLAQSLDASRPPGSAPITPSASPRSDPCAPMSGLPAAMDGRTLDVTISEGVTTIDPQDLIDPLLAGLGRTHEDVCVASVGTGHGGDALAGQLLRVAGADAPDLAERLAVTLSDRLTRLGARASASPTDLDGTTVWTLDIVAEGQPTHIVIGQVGDTLLITSDPVALRFLATLLMSAAAPSPSPALRSASPAG